MSTFKRISKSDVVTVPYVANKQWDFSHLNINSSSIFVYTGQKMTGSFDLYSDPMTVNSQYQRLIYDSINQQFYNKYSGSLLDTGSLSKSLNYESASSYIASSSFLPNLNISYSTSSFPEQPGDKIAVLTIPPKIYGDSVSPGTFRLSSSVYQIVDDTKGNLKHGDVFVGNIFYPQGLAVITNQAYQAYFTDTNTTVVNWYNSSMPNNYFIDSNLKINVNGEERVLEYGDNRGRFTLNVGDSVHIETWSDGTWPMDGTASLNLSVTGQSSLNTSQSRAYLTSSFVVASQTPIYVGAYTAYTPDTQPYNIRYNVTEYSQSSGSIFIDARLKILSSNRAVTYLDVTGSSIGNLLIPADQNLIVEVQSDTSNNTGSVWGPYESASLFYELKQGSTVVTSSTNAIYINSGIASASSVVDLDPGTTYTLVANTTNPTRPVDPAIISWNLREYLEPGAVFLDGNFKVQTVGGATVFLDQKLGGSGSLSIPANTPIEIQAYSLTNDGTSSLWNNYVSSSLTGQLTQSGVVIASGNKLTGRNQGTASVTLLPPTTVEAGVNYLLNVTTAPTLIPHSMSFSSTAVGGLSAYIDNAGVFSNGVTPQWIMAWDRTLGSGQLQPENSTYAPFAFDGQTFTAKSLVSGFTTQWGPYNQCDTVIDVYENAVLIKTASSSFNSTSYPTTGSWEVYASVTFTPTSGSIYQLNAYNTNLRSGSVPAYYAQTLGYDATTCANACSAYTTAPITMYAGSSSLSIGTALYYNTGLTTPAVDGKYSNGTTCYTVVSGSITSNSACSVPSRINVNFGLSIDTINTGALSIYTKSPSDSGYTLSSTLYDPGASFVASLLPGDSFYSTITHTGRDNAGQRGQINTIVNSISTEMVSTTSGALPQSVNSSPTIIVTGSTYNVQGYLGTPV